MIGCDTPRACAEEAGRRGSEVVGASGDGIILLAEGEVMVSEELRNEPDSCYGLVRGGSCC